ncbi:hypothetical protein DRV85_06490 [Rhodosalinus halophilus]|uniref:Uncharacterized protein n=2 Tax=Rhodosalinus halophilus TaxID=2259333 RepID=A0A365UAZ7_9RHOB|nr:hypothetical protein DRV85_06490 [Rhodosalinus halophilus]
MLLPRLIAFMDRWLMAEASELAPGPVCMEVEADVTIAGIGRDAARTIMAGIDAKAARRG